MKQRSTTGEPDGARDSLEFQRKGGKPMKKIVSLLVVLAMLLSIAPAVFAEGDFGGESYQELVMGENVAVYTAETDTAR